MGDGVMELTSQQLPFVESSFLRGTLSGVGPEANRSAQLRREEEEDGPRRLLPKCLFAEHAGPRKQDHDREPDKHGAARSPPGKGVWTGA